MFGSAAWRRHREARARAAREHLVRELCARAAVREAETLVESAWIDGLDHAEQTDPTVRAVLEREREAFARATRRRAAEAENDQRKMAALTEEIAQAPRMAPPSG